MHRGQASVAGRDAVASLLFEVVQERADQRRVEVLEFEPGGWPAGPLLGECEQQRERVAIGGDRVRADAPLTDQPLGEERLKRGREQSS